MAANYHDRFRKNLRRAMHEHQDTMGVICERAGYNVAYVRKVMREHNSNPTLLFMSCMAQAVDTDLLDLLGKDVA